MFVIDADEAISRIYDLEREGKIGREVRIEVEQVLVHMPSCGSSKDYFEIDLPAGTLIYIPDGCGCAYEVWYERHRGE